MDIVSIGTAILALVAITSVVIQHNRFKQSQEEFIRTLKADHTQRRREVALSLWDLWIERCDDQNGIKLFTFLKWIEVETDVEAKKLWLEFVTLGGKTPHSVHEQTQPTKNMKEIFGVDVVTIYDLESMKLILTKKLDIMEKIATAYQHHIADQEIINNAFKQVIIVETMELKTLIDLLRKNNNNDDAWKTLTDLVFHGEWKDVKKKIESGPSADSNAFMYDEIGNNSNASID